MRYNNKPMKHYDFEEDFHKKDKKAVRKERKRLSEKDRSKYKKTDLLKKGRETSTKDTEKGRVVSISGEGSVVDWKGDNYLCSLKGF